MQGADTAENYGPGANGRLLQSCFANSTNLIPGSTPSICGTHISSSCLADMKTYTTPIPFIFGKRMLYTNCKQSKSQVLRHLDRGSVIAFGSKKNHRWILDTVFVVAGSVSYAAPEARIALADHASDAFLEVTAGPLADNGETGPFTFYWGATPEDPVEGMFSFFPAMIAEGSVGFERPVISLPKPYFTETLGRWIKSPRDLAPSTLFRLWQSLVDQVLNAGLVLGTHAALPERRVLPREGALRKQVSGGPPRKKKGRC